jgi:outer membrane protein assembly factor BamB
MRWWMPAAIVALAGGALALVYLGDSDHGWQNFLTLGIGVLAGTLLVAWFILFTGLRWQTRVGLLAGAIAAVTAWWYCVRVDGVDGDMHVKLIWSWSRAPDTALPDLPARGGAAATAGEAEGPAPRPDDSPQFLGPDREPVIRGVRLARDWSARPPRELWRTEVGAGWGSFAVAGPLAITQEQRGNKELIVCRDRDTGAVRWSHANAVRFDEKMGGPGPRATPTVTGGRVYALGATGILDCLDAATGEPVWSKDTLGKAGVPNLNWGKSCSPLVADGLVFVSLGEGEQPNLAAYRTTDGSPAWRAGSDAASYASPLVTTLAGTRQVVMMNAHSVTGHDPADGRVLWTFPWPDPMAKASQPVPLSGDRLLLTCGYGEAAVLLRLRADGGALAPEKVWGNRRLRTKFTTVAVRDGHAYGLDDGALVCVNVDTGERAWQARRRYGHGQVLLVEDLLLVQCEDGEVVLAEASPKGHRELGRMPALSGKTWNNPALAGRQLFLRNGREAACYELPLEE